MRSRFHSKRFIAPACAMIAFIWGLTLSSCGAVVPRAARSVDLLGRGQTLDLSFIKPGTTRRDEIQSKLGWMDIGWNEPQAFWGRWSRSSQWHLVDLQRDIKDSMYPFYWRAQNLLIEFDGSDVVKSHQVFDDDAVSGVIQGWLSRNVQTRAEPSLVLLVRRRSIHDRDRYRYSKRSEREARLILGRDSLHFTWGTQLLSMRMDDIGRISFEGTGLEPTDIAITLHVTEPAVPGSEVSFDAEIPEAVTLIRYLSQHKPGALK